MAAGEQVILELFVQGQSPRSIDALEVVKSVCEAELKDRYKLEVVDIYQYSERAVKEGIIATPTLVRLHPEPVLRTIGNLNAQRVLEGLGLDEH